MIFQIVNASELQEGQRVRYLGRLYTVTGVRPSLGSGYEVTFSDGPSANFVGAVGIVDEQATTEFAALPCAAPEARRTR